MKLTILGSGKCISHKQRGSSGYLTPNEVIKIIIVTKLKKVVVTHFYPECDEEKVVETIRSNVDIEVIEAQDFLRIEI